jgi:hypothetical protein
MATVVVQQSSLRGEALTFRELRRIEKNIDAKLTEMEQHRKRITSLTSEDWATVRKLVKQFGWERAIDWFVRVMKEAQES